MTTATPEPRVYHQGDPEPPVGTTVLRADGIPVTRWQLGWMPGPYNWVGITSLGDATEVKPPRQPAGVTIELVEGAAKRDRVHLGAKAGE
jgi:hypothetical protein